MSRSPQSIPNQNLHPHAASPSCSVTSAYPEFHGEPQRVLKHLLFSFFLLSGCNGGATQSTAIPATVTPADFSLVLSSTSITIPQGGVSQPLTLSVNPANSFASSVQITLANLPAGVTSNPASPFAIAAGAKISVIFGASATSAPGNSTITAQAISGSLSHSATLALSI